MKVEAEIGEMLPQTKGCLGPTEVREPWDRSSLIALRRNRFC